MGKVVSGLLSIVGLGGSPKTSGASTAALKGDQASAVQARASLYGTDGGVNGDQLNPDQVKKRDTLFGN